MMITDDAGKEVTPERMGKFAHDMCTLKSFGFDSWVRSSRERNQQRRSRERDTDSQERSTERDKEQSKCW